MPSSRKLVSPTRKRQTGLAKNKKIISQPAVLTVAKSSSEERPRSFLKDFLPFGYSFRFLRNQEADDILNSKNCQALVAPQKVIDDEKRRLFLKTLGVIGAGAVGASMLPKKAEALVMGGTPGASVVGVKNTGDVRIDPATEGTAGSIKTATEATQTSAGLIKTNTDTLATNSNKFTFSNGSLVITGPNSADPVGLKNTSGTTINPATDDAVVLLRRMVKLMESQATVDSANRQRITLDSWGLASTLLGTGTSANCARVALGSDSTVGTVTSVTNVVTIGSYTAQQMFGDVSHDVYANALRKNLTFTSSV